jgi:hypothetical protein
MTSGNQSTPVRKSRAERERRDLVRSTACLWIWGIPIALAILNKGLQEADVVPSVVTGIGWVVVTWWIGAACFLNGLRCGRVHCRIDGIVLPLLGLVAVAKMVGVVSLSWSMYNNIFWAVVIASFLPEIFGLKYGWSRRR